MEKPVRFENETDEVFSSRYKEWRVQNGVPVLNDEDADYKAAMQRAMSEPAKKPLANGRGQSAKPYSIQFIEPGIVFYEHLNEGKGGMVLVKKEAIDKMLPTIVGKPIFNWMHKEVTNSDYDAGRAQGTMALTGKDGFNPANAWFYVTGLVWDNETRDNIENQNYSVSCAYDVTKWGPAGTYHNIPYDAEVLEGEFTHMAIVQNPRYEGARIGAEILYNQGGRMKMKFWPFKKDEKPEDAKPTEVELTNAKISVKGKEVDLSAVIERYSAEQDLLEGTELLNGLKDDDEIEVRGRKVRVSVLRQFAASLQNESVDDMKSDHKDGKHDEKELDNCPMCGERKNEADDKKEKEDADKKEEMKNSSAHAAGSHADAPLENCLSCTKEWKEKGLASFDELANAARSRDGKFEAPEGLKSMRDRVAEGDKRYGKKSD